MGEQQRVRDLDGATVLLEHRFEQEVDIRPDGHMLCVNFQTQRDATYAYAGARPWHGTRHVGMAHLIEPEHHITGFVREPTDHVVLTLERDWLSQLAIKSVDAARFDLVSNGVPYHDGQLRRFCEAMRDELSGPADPLMLDALTTATGIHLLRTASDLGPTDIERRHALSPRKVRQVREAIEANLVSGRALGRARTSGRSQSRSSVALLQGRNRPDAASVPDSAASRIGARPVDQDGHLARRSERAGRILEPVAHDTRVPRGVRRHSGKVAARERVRSPEPTTEASRSCRLGTVMAGTTAGPGAWRSRSRASRSSCTPGCSVRNWAKDRDVHERRNPPTAWIPS